MTAEPVYLPRTQITLDDARGKLAGWHFSQEALDTTARDILYVAEALLREIDERADIPLRDQDYDAILAALEAALNARLDFGPGIPARIVEEAGRRIEKAREGQAMTPAPRLYPGRETR